MLQLSSCGSFRAILIFHRAMRRTTRFATIFAARFSTAVASRPIVECYYSLSSPWMYLGGPTLQDIIHRHDCELVLKPYDFQAVAPAAGGIPLRTRPEARRSYHALELARWSEYLEMPLNLEPAHYKPNFDEPVDPCWNKYPGWMVIAAQLTSQNTNAAFELSHALLKALWADERDTTDPKVRVSIAEEVGLNGAELLELERSPQVQAAYDAYTQEALEKGVFGAPTFVLCDERFWGQDRLPFLDRKLQQLGAGGIAL